MTSPTTVPAPFPPGLVPDAVAGVEQDKTAEELKAVAVKAMEEKISRLEGITDKAGLEAAVRKLVLEEVEQRVQEKAEVMWQKGKQMLISIQAKHKDKTEALMQSVQQCQQRAMALEAENAELKQVIFGLAGQMQITRQAMQFGGAPKPAVNGTSTLSDGSTVAPTPNTDSPAVFTPQAEAGRTTEGLKLPDLPDFPFGNQLASPAPALSLAEALGQQTPQRQPLSLASTLTPPATPGQFTDPAAPFKFTFTLRKADGADLGLNVSHQGEDTVLRVEGVRPEGAVDAWNRQCASSQATMMKEVRAGDIITSVNDVSGDPVKMLEQCRDKQLLKLAVERNRMPPALAVEAPTKSTTLRAEASVFVPQGAAAQTPPATEGETETEATTEKDK